MRNHSEAFDDLVRQLKSAGAKLEESDLVSLLLLTLPDIFDSLVTALENLYDVTWNQWSSSCSLKSRSESIVKIAQVMTRVQHSSEGRRMKGRKLSVNLLEDATGVRRPTKGRRTVPGRSLMELLGMRSVMGRQSLLWEDLMSRRRPVEAKFCSVWTRDAVTTLYKLSEVLTEVEGTVCRIAKNLESKRTKHIDIKHHFIRNHVAAGNVNRN